MKERRIYQRNRISVAQETIKAVFEGPMNFKISQIVDIVEEIAGRELPGHPVNQRVGEMKCVEPDVRAGAGWGSYVRIFDPCEVGKRRCEREGCRFAWGQKRIRCPRYEEARLKKNSR